MTTSYTSNYGLAMPAQGAGEAEGTPWDAEVNGNFVAIDSLIKTNADAISVVGTPGIGDIVGLTPALAAKEDVANKDIDGTLAANSDTRYPSQKAIKTYIDSLPPPVAGPHTHPESDIINLVSDLAGKAPVVHTHAQSDVTGLTAALAGKASTVHTHAESDVTNLVTDLAAKAPLVHVHSAADITTGVLAPARGGVANLAGTTGFFPLLAGPFGLISLAANGGVTGNNQVRCMRFVLLERTVVARATLTCAAAVVGATFACGIYDSSLSRLIQWGTFDGNSATTQSLTAGAITLDAGEYWFAWSNSNVSATMQCFVINNTIAVIIGKTNTNVGSSSNNYSAGMPSSLGTITNITNGINVACVFIEAA